MNKLEQLMAQIQELIKSALAPKVDVVKSVDVEKRLALFVAMEPDVFDAHGDITSAEEVEKACHNFNEHCMVANLFHKVETQDAVIRESYITPVDMQLGEQFVSKGTWVQTWYFPETDVGNKLWDMVKTGEITGLSIGGKGIAEAIE